MKESISENIRCITKDDPEYPVKMKQYPSMPNKLYVKGRLPLAEKPAVADDWCKNVQPIWQNSGIPVCESIK